MVDLELDDRNWILWARIVIRMQPWPFKLTGSLSSAMMVQVSQDTDRLGLRLSGRDWARRESDGPA